MKVISIANQKGGCGKTTTAINLAGTLAHKGHKVLLIDLDPQAHASSGLGIKTEQLERSVYNVLTSSDSKRKKLSEVVLNLAENLHLAPGHILLSTLEQELRNEEDAVSMIYKAINSLVTSYDYIIIDCPPSLGFLTFNALRASHLVIMPLQCCSLSLKGVSKLINMVELIQLKMQRAPKIKALITLYEKRTNYSKKMHEEINRHFKDNIFKTTIRANITLRESADKGVPAIVYDKYCNGTHDYGLLAEEVVAECRRLFLDDFYQEAEDFMADMRSKLKVQTFTIHSPDAREIHIVGDFNNWKADGSSRLQKMPDGGWQRKVALKPGIYKYKYVVDGEWLRDPNNTKTIPNAFGGVDSVLVV